MEWISVQFSSPDRSQRAAALRGAGLPADVLDRARHIPKPELDLLPLAAGTNTESLAFSVDALRRSPASFRSVHPVFQAGDVEMLVTTEFIAFFPPDWTADQIDRLNSAHGVEMLRPLLGPSNAYLLGVTSSAPLDALAMANLYVESGVALDAEPNFVRLIPRGPEPSAGPAPRAASESVGPQFVPSDPYFSDQWSLHNTAQYGVEGMVIDADIDAPEAWDRARGSASVIIAILDEGVELTQPDLIGKLVPGYDATDGATGGTAGAPCTPTPCGFDDDAHGTNVAGIAAAASNNSLGISGVCQDCSIMPVRIAYSAPSGSWIYTDEGIANGITWAYQNGASVLNNSWAGGSDSTAINTAITNAKNLGRAGKGSVVVFAAGNADASPVQYPASLPSVIAVGALNMCDQRKQIGDEECGGNETTWGSNYGSALDISAAGVWLDSTDRAGPAGYDTDAGSAGDYYLYMNGTSGATPIVSGVAGLVLSVNPSLTADQVQTVLQNTADDLGTPGRDDQTGYGRVNAVRAVHAAFGAETIGITSAGTFYLRNSNSAGPADITFGFGWEGPIPLVGDWNADGATTVGIDDGGWFFLRNANSAGPADLIYQYGWAGATPLIGDWNGDGVDTVGIYSAGWFFLRNSNSPGPADLVFSFGWDGPTPLVGDWNGDGTDTVGLYSNGTFFLRNSNSAGPADLTFSFGWVGPTPLVGDWNGDGLTTVGITSAGTFFLRNSNSAGPADVVFSYGWAGATPLAGTWGLIP